MDLFSRVGGSLEITDSGRLVLSYADEIFSLGAELEGVIHQLPVDRPRLFRVGVVDVLPKSIAHRILQPALMMPESVHLICHEASLDTLLAELTVHRLDLVLADCPIPPAVSTRGFSHILGECGVSFFATKKIDNKLKGDFPHCLDGAPLLLPSSGNQLRFHIDWWLDKHRIHPHEIAEFDDSALMKAFGQKGAGRFIAPSAIDAEVEWQYQAMAIGRTEEVLEEFYAISVERKISHSAVAAITETVREWLVPCCTAAQAEKEQKIGNCRCWHIRYVILTLFPAKSSIRTYSAGNRNVAIDPRQALEGRSTLVQQYFIRSRIKS